MACANPPCRFSESNHSGLAAEQEGPRKRLASPAPARGPCACSSHRTFGTFLSVSRAKAATVFPPLDPAPDAGQAKERFNHARAQAKAKIPVQLRRARDAAREYELFTGPVAGAAVGEQAAPIRGLLPQVAPLPNASRSRGRWVACPPRYLLPCRGSVMTAACFSLRAVATRWWRLAAGGRALRAAKRTSTARKIAPAKPTEWCLTGAANASCGKVSCF